ncbi:hypothetical protein LPJ61_005413 [Coemansia biformis]|uniref:Uncharacterized protein n=1 Tax=Coemansia biformis TaxID=1286918 RepID=A0A9W7Y8V8_9FUNG|nr:hypothetical protein LPJ61_005413 [Coemansia biformis]
MAAAGSRSSRRCHSITILSESEPLLMERGVEFFGRPRSASKQKQRLSRHVLYAQAADRAHMARRILTAPTATLRPAMLRSFAVDGPLPPNARAPAVAPAPAPTPVSPMSPASPVSPPGK